MLGSDVCDDRQLIHTFRRYLLSTYYGLGRWLEAWGRAVSKIQVLTLRKPCSDMGSWFLGQS